MELLGGAEPFRHEGRPLFDHPQEVLDYLFRLGFLTEALPAAFGQGIAFRSR
jgi:hypothetical protein